MKKVYSSHREVAHVWAQQNQPEGSASNMFFENDTIYSYGHHFPIARFVNPETVLFTTHSYSVSTAKHISRTSQAILHKKRFYVDNVKADCKDAHKLNYLKMIESVRHLLDKASRARTNKSWLFNQAMERENSAFEYAKMFKIRTPRKKITESEDIKICLENAFKQLEEHEKRKEQKAAKKMLRYWQNSEAVSLAETVTCRMEQFLYESGHTVKIRELLKQAWAQR